MPAPLPQSAKLKTAAIESACERWIAADHSKFEKIYAAGFCALNKASIITDCLPEQACRDYTTVSEGGWLK